MRLYCSSQGQAGTHIILDRTPRAYSHACFSVEGAFIYTLCTCFSQRMKLVTSNVFTTRQSRVTFGFNKYGETLVAPNYSHNWIP